MSHVTGLARAATAVQCAHCSVHVKCTSLYSQAAGGGVINSSWGTRRAAGMLRMLALAVLRLQLRMAFVRTRSSGVSAVGDKRCPSERDDAGYAVIVVN